MPSATGSFQGKANWQTTVSVKDAPEHEIGLAEISGPQKSSDPLWNGATVTYWGVADLAGGNGTQKGYFINRHANGDTDHGTFEGTVAIAAGAVSLEGRWQFTGGTGALARLSGGGAYKGRAISPTEVDMSWEGSYQLG